MRPVRQALLCAIDEERGWVLVTGGDYAGFYQEEFLWGALAVLEVGLVKPTLFYAPVVEDWSGAKLSKSLYVEQCAYGYMRESGMCAVLDGKWMIECGGVEAAWAEVWWGMLEPFRLFRNYGVEFLWARLRGQGLRVEDEQGVEEEVAEEKLPKVPSVLNEEEASEQCFDK